MLKFGGDQRRLSSRARTLIYREFDAGCALRFSPVAQISRLHHSGRREAGNGQRANAVVFGVLHALIPRPLNVPQAESLYELERASDKLGFESYPNYLDLRDRNRTFEGLAAFSIGVLALLLLGLVATWIPKQRALSVNPAMLLRKKVNGLSLKGLSSSQGRGSPYSG